MSYFADDDGSSEALLGLRDTSWTSSYAHLKRQAESFLGSNTKHYIVLSLVVLDVGAILADIFIALVACDLHLEGEEWVLRTREGLHIVTLVFSSLFLVELLVTVWAYGRSFFEDWFHCFDGFVILASFIIDVVTKGILEEIGSMIIVLRLWRFIKIVEELSLGRMEDIEAKVENLRRENEELKSEAEALRSRLE
ncbi:hypothetical protein OQA88_9780 [Cercophora sp. LCS_1]